MNVWPILLRELRAESRKSGNHWLRVMGGMAGALVFWFLSWGRDGHLRDFGIELFISLHITVTVLIWVMVPLLTADCISRERREGTLGLLFLTPLTVRTVIIAKCLSQSLRAILLWLSVVPIMSLSLLMGGVSVEDMVTALVLQSVSLLLAMVAGLTSSSCSLRWGTAMATSVFTAAWIVVFAGVMLALVALFYLLPHTPGFTWDEFWREFGVSELFFISVVLMFGGVFGEEAGWSEIFQGFPNWWPEWQVVLLQFALLSVLLCLFLIRRATQRVTRVVQAAPLSGKTAGKISSMATRKLTPKRYKRIAHGLLTRNPIRWQLRRTIPGRITGWVWGLVVVLACLFFLEEIDYRRGMERGLVLFILMAGMAFTAATFLQRQRESGELELLFVTPQPMSAFLRNWLMNIWEQFTVPLLVLILDWVIMAMIEPVGSASGDWLEVLWSHQFAHSGFAVISAVAFPLIPVVGLYFSMSRMQYLWAWGVTVMITLGLPALAYYVVSRIMEVPDHGVASWGAVICQLIAFVVFWRLLWRRLNSRAFALPG